MNKQYNDYWEECNECQGSDYNEILCKNEDCNNFYRRIKMENDLEIKMNEYQRFEWEFWSMAIIIMRLMIYFICIVDISVLALYICILCYHNLSEYIKLILSLSINISIAYSTF